MQQHATILLLLLGTFFSSYAQAELIVVNPDTGEISIDSQPFSSAVDLHGVTILGSGVSSSVREFLVFGNLELLAGDSLQAVQGANNGVRFVVGNDAIISAGAEIDFSASGQSGGAGGGQGGTPGLGGSSFLGGSGGQGGSGGAARLFNTSQGDRGEDGRNGSRGGSGNQGRNGASGNSGSPGGQGINNTLVPTITPGGNGGSRGATRSSSVSVGRGGNGGTGSSGQGGRGGTHGFDGLDGNNGMGGGNGQNGNGGGQITEGFLLIGGNGGSGGGGGGGGGSGGGGAGGSGGGAGGSGGGGTNFGGRGGAGGDGSDGGDGGRGGNGGNGGNGGGGGGVIEISAFGRVLFDGSGTAKGANGVGGSNGVGNNSFGRPSGSINGGSDGANGAGGSGGNGSSISNGFVGSSSSQGGGGGGGGAGGFAGDGGDGADGGRGGRGGGGAGGTFSLNATVVSGSGSVDLTGGNTAEDGRLLIQSNAGVRSFSLQGVGAQNEQLALLATNPFSGLDSVNLLDLVGGASPFGFSSLSASSLLSDEGIAVGANSLLTAILLDDTSILTDENIVGQDLLLVLNTSGNALDDVTLGYDQVSTTLLEGGFATTTTFGGTGATTNGTLEVDSVYATSIPEGAFDFVELSATQIDSGSPIRIEDTEFQAFPGGLFATLSSSDLVGDFDSDGDVDSDDLVQWQSDYGVNGDSDADGDGDTDGADFLAWQRNFGATTSTSALAVPEPSSLITLLLAALLPSHRSIRKKAGACKKHCVSYQHSVEV